MNGKWMFLLAGALTLAIGVELFHVSGEHHGTAWWSHVPGFFALFGFFVCLGLAFLAKALGKHWLQKDERYYQRGRVSRD
jgi:thiol:disulfide interchange protein